MFRLQSFQAVFCVCLVTIFEFHLATSRPPGFSINLIPRDSPVSPLYPGNLTNLERIERLISFSNARGYYLENFSGLNGTVETDDNIRFPLLRDNFFYMVQVGIGSQGIPEFLLLDTGAGLIWTQCQPCVMCYKVQFPIYDSQSSSSYQKLSCDHPFCKGDHPLYSCVNNECRYQYSYGGGASTSGVASTETFKFTTSPIEAKLVEGIVFGCSNNNQNIQFSKNGIISGILGLNRSPDSLVSQLGDSVGKRFSYCLIPFTQVAQPPSLLRFGDDIPPSAGNIKTTKFVAPPAGTYYYYLHLLDISVGWTRIGFAPEVFQFRPDGQGGCLIDSGALISRIDQGTVGRNAYRAVMGAFQRFYDSKKLERIGQVPQGFALCYRNPQGFKDFVTMTYHFEGADYVVEPQYVHYFDTDAGHFCVALTPGNGRTILGAWHQQNMRIIYNGNIGALQFNSEDCTKDTS